MARLSQVFVPRDREFFDLFEEAGANILRAADLLDRMLRNYPDTKELAREILLCEQEGDRITHDIVQRLNQTFVTPIDREDILELASALDDIVDLTEEVADYLGLYKVEAPMEQAQRLAHILMQACRQIAEAMPRMRDFKDISHYTVGDPPARERGRPRHARSDRVAVRHRHRPDGRDPLEGPVRAPRGRGRRDRAGREHAARASSSRTRDGAAPTSSSGSSSPPRWRSTSRTASTTPRTSSRRRSRRARCRRAWRSRSRRSSTSSARSCRSRSPRRSRRTSSTSSS